MWRSARLTAPGAGHGRGPRHLPRARETANGGDPPGAAATAAKPPAAARGGAHGTCMINEANAYQLGTAEGAQRAACHYKTWEQMEKSATSNAGSLLAVPCSAPAKPRSCPGRADPPARGCRYPRPCAPGAAGAVLAALRRALRRVACAAGRRRLGVDAELCLKQTKCPPNAPACGDTAREQCAVASQLFCIAYAVSTASAPARLAPASAWAHRGSDASVKKK